MLRASYEPCKTGILHIEESRGIATAAIHSQTARVTMCYWSSTYRIPASLHTWLTNLDSNLSRNCSVAPREMSANHCPHLFRKG